MSADRIRSDSYDDDGFMIETIPLYTWDSPTWLDPTVQDNSGDTWTVEDILRSAG